MNKCRKNGTSQHIALLHSASKRREANTAPNIPACDSYLSQEKQRKHQNCVSKESDLFQKHDRPIRSQVANGSTGCNVLSIYPFKINSIVYRTQSSRVNIFK